MISVRIYDDETEEGEVIQIVQVGDTKIYEYVVFPIPDDGYSGYSGTLYNFNGNHTELLGEIIRGRNVS